MKEFAMRAWGGVLAWGCVLSAAAYGQSPAGMQSDLAPAPAGPLPPLSVAAEPPLLPPPPLPQAADARGPAGAWNADLLLGLPIAVRVQRLLDPGRDHGLALEGLAGLYAIFPLAGGGLRWHCAPVCGRHDAL